MATKKELVQFTIINDTDCDFNIPLFQQNVYSINATTKYSWDITSEDLSCGTGSIVINGVTYAFTFAPNLAGLLAALNALGFGFFCSETIGGSTYIYTVDDTNIYGLLSLCSTGPTTTTTTSTTTVAPTTTTTSTSTTTAAPTTTTSTTSTTTAAPTTTTSTTSTTTAAPTTTTTSTSTTTAAPTTTTSTTSTTTAAPTTTTSTTSTTTAAPTTTTSTTSTTTEAPTTTTTTTSTTTEAPTTTTTTTSTTTEAPTTTTTTTTTTTVAVTCEIYDIIPDNNLGFLTVNYTECNGTPNSISVNYPGTAQICAQVDSVTFSAGEGTYNTSSVTCYASNAINVHLSNVSAGDACLQGTTQVWMHDLDTFTTGTTLYTDAALTTVLTGYDFVVQDVPTGNPVYNLNTATGVIGTVTGTTC